MSASVSGSIDNRNLQVLTFLIRVSVVFTIWKIHVQIDFVIRHHHWILICQCAWGTCAWVFFGIAGWLCAFFQFWWWNKSRCKIIIKNDTHSVEKLSSIDTRIVQKNMHTHYISHVFLPFVRFLLPLLIILVIFEF